MGRLEKIRPAWARKDENSMSQKLKTATEDLLIELGISPVSLEIMSEGYSPNYRHQHGVEHTDDLHRLVPKVQISSVVASKLINALKD